MELHKLKYFMAVAKYQHMTKAAEEIHIAQPSLTQAIHSLEEELGVKLFMKRGRGIYLTRYGSYLKARLDVILPQIENLPREIENLKEKGKKRVRLNILAASTMVINAIMDYRKSHPDVIFDFEQSNTKSSCDILVATDGVSEEYNKDYIKRVILSEEIFLAVPKVKEFEKVDRVDLCTLKKAKFVMFSSARLYGLICKKFCALAGFTPEVLFESDSPLAVQNIISTGTGVAFWPEYSWGKLKNQNVKLLKIDNPPCKRNIIFQLLSNLDGSEAAGEFFNYLVNYKNIYIRQ